MTGLWLPSKDGRKVPVVVSVDGFARLLTNPIWFREFVLAVDFHVPEPRTRVIHADPFIMRGRVLRNLYIGESLSPEETKWVMSFISRPGAFMKKNRGRPNSRHDLLVTILVALAGKAGVKPFRNETSVADSACDMVADAFRQIGWTPNSYSGVKAVYLKGRQRFGAVPVASKNTIK